jgi:hypothetical protein
MSYKDHPNYMNIVRAVAKARRDAWNTASRESTEVIDAEIFLASLDALGQASSAFAGTLVGSPPPESQPLTEPPSTPVEVTPEEPPLPPLEWTGTPGNFEGPLTNITPEHE